MALISQDRLQNTHDKLFARGNQLIKQIEDIEKAGKDPRCLISKFKLVREKRLQVYKQLGGF